MSKKDDVEMNASVKVQICNEGCCVEVSIAGEKGYKWTNEALSYALTTLAEQVMEKDRTSSLDFPKIKKEEYAH